MAFIFKGGITNQSCKLIPTLDREQTARYRRFRRLLEHNRTGLTIMADLEQIYYDNRPFLPPMVVKKCSQLLIEVDGMVNALSGMTHQDYEHLHSVINNVTCKLKDGWTGSGSRDNNLLTLPLQDIEHDHARYVGNKAANLALIARELQLPVPPGFSITTNLFWLYLEETGLAAEIDDFLAELADDDPIQLESVSRKIREHILATPLPAALIQAINQAAAGFTQNQRLAVRSSAIGEDSEVSFAGQYTSVLNVPISHVEQAYREVVASKYAASALSYRMHHGLDDRDTPMSVLVLAMVEPQLSGVAFTADPTGVDRDTVRVSAVSGLGDELVGGSASSEKTFEIDKSSGRLLNPDHQEAFSLATNTATLLQELRNAALRMEQHFRNPLDIEWAVDAGDKLCILQVRPLMVLDQEQEEAEETPLDYPGHPLLLQGGKCIAPGIAAGKVLVTSPIHLTDPAGLTFDPDTILVVKTASTAITPWMGRISGIITDIGSNASHLASVAREFGVPALFDTHTATQTLKTGNEITLWANQRRVYQGRIDTLLQLPRQVKKPIFHTAAYQRLQQLLDSISPLNLTDPNSADFIAEKCQTLHDIIRYCHELSVRSMFHFGETLGSTSNAVHLKVTIPISLFALDLGGGLRPGLTTCDEISAYDVICIPFISLWRGFTHPGINWFSAVAVGAQDFMSLMMAGARPQPGNELGRASYVILSGDYFNLNIRFGYHFATIDALCSKDTEQNYITLNFTGGAGAYHGKSLRLQYLANVLNHLGFEVSIQGEMLKAGLLRLDLPSMDLALDQLGRLLGSSRLLDMALKSPDQVRSLTEAFFAGNYDVLREDHPEAPSDYYLITGDWKNHVAEGQAVILQDGSQVVSPLSIGITQTMTRILGKRYRQFLDNIEAYCYFPLAIAKKSIMAEGSARVQVMPQSGSIAQSGGLAFAIKDWGNYFVLRLNALEGNVILFEFRNGKQIERHRTTLPIISGQWYQLGIAIHDGRIEGWVNEQATMRHMTDTSLHGHLGLWTKADSVTLFRDLSFTRK